MGWHWGFFQNAALDNVVRRVLLHEWDLGEDPSFGHHVARCCLANGTPEWARDPFQFAFLRQRLKIEIFETDNQGCLLLT